MRCGIILAAILMIASASGAHAQQWCGYLGRPYSIIQCGYSSLEGCENAVGNGKGAMCFVNPDVTLNSRRATPVIATKHSGVTSRPDPLELLIRNLLQCSMSI
jgi:hypothetical protein